MPPTAGWRSSRCWQRSRRSRTSGVERLSPGTALPSIRGSRSETRLVLAGLAALMVALKFLFHIHFSLFGFGFWAAIVLAAGFVFVARRLHAAG